MSFVAKNQSHRRMLAKVSPCGFFSIYEEKKGQRKSERVVNSVERWDAAVRLVQQENPGVGRAEASGVVLRRVREMRAALRSASRGGGAKPLDLTRATNSHVLPKTRAPRGFSGLSGYAKRLTYSSITYLQEKYGKHRLTFLTVTIPGVEEEVLQAIQANWSEIVRRFTQELTRKLKSSGLPGEIVGVTEIQSRREMRTGQAVPHLHIVFVGKHAKGTWVLTPAKVKKQWKRTIKTVTGSNLDMNGSVDMRQVRKSAARYLSKYLSKGRTKAAANPITGEITSFVSCWYLCSLRLRRLYARSITCGNVAATVLLEEIAKGNKEVKSFDMFVDTKDGYSFKCCIYGWLNGTIKDLLAQSMYKREQFEDELSNG